MLAAAVLVLTAVIYRIVLGTADGDAMGWWQNFSPLAAIALCGAIYFPRRVAISFPLLALFVSDLILNAHFHAPMLTFDILPRYMALGLIAAFGWLLRDNPRTMSVLASSLAGSTIFFIVTNTGSWLSDPGYAGTFTGWTAAMTTGLPGYPSTLLFFRNTLLSDLLFTGLFLLCIAAQGRKEGIPHPARTGQLASW